MNHLTFQMSGSQWSHLKHNPDEFPPIESLKKSQLWACEQLYKYSVWSWLTEGGESFTAASAAALQTQQGEVVVVDVSIGNRQEKLMFGGQGPLLNSRSEATLLVADVGGPGGTAENPSYWPLELMQAIGYGKKQKFGMRLAIWCSDDDCELIMKGPMTKLLSTDFRGYKVRVLSVFLPKDEPLAGKTVWNSNVCRKVILVSPTPFKKAWDVVVTHLSWTPTLIGHFVNVMDMLRSFFSLCAYSLPIMCA